MIRYSELLKDPRWQKKRLEILDRDNWTCQSCGDKKGTLHVHHLWYGKNINPWDYKSPCLITLCDNCHKFEHENSELCKATLIRAINSKGFLSSDIIGTAEWINKTDAAEVKQMFGV